MHETSLREAHKSDQESKKSSQPVPSPSKEIVAATVSLLRGLLVLIDRIDLDGDSDIN
jgi:hypothetical protein